MKIPFVVRASVKTAIVGILLGASLTAFAQTVVYSAGMLTQSGITDINAKQSNPGWTSNSFGCSSGSLQGYHYQAQSSNNTTWYACSGSAGDTSYGVGAGSCSGYNTKWFHADFGDSNNATWNACQKN